MLKKYAKEKNKTTTIILPVTFATNITKPVKEKKTTLHQKQKSICWVESYNKFDLSLASTLSQFTQ